HLEGLADLGVEGLLEARMAVGGLPEARVAVGGLPEARMAVGGPPRVRGSREEELRAQEEPSSGGIGGVLMGGDDVGAALEQKAGHRRDDPGPVGAGDQEAGRIALAVLIGEGWPMRGLLEFAHARVPVISWRPPAARRCSSWSSWGPPGSRRWRPALRGIAARTVRWPFLHRSGSS